MPPISDEVDRRIKHGALPVELAEAFDDIGHFFQRVAADIFEARSARAEKAKTTRSTKRRKKTDPDAAVYRPRVFPVRKREG